MRGEYAGRTAGWDALTWSERGIPRVKRTLSVLGLDVRGEIDLEPNDLVGLGARVSFESEEREDAQSGRRVVRLRVPYAGYAALEGLDSSANGHDSTAGGEPASAGSKTLEHEFDDPLDVDSSARA